MLTSLGAYVVAGVVHMYDAMQFHHDTLGPSICRYTMSTLCDTAKGPQ
jgi:hypothetical protein